MMLDVKLAILFFSAFGVAILNGQLPAETTFESLLFKPLCKNPMTKAAFDMCYTAVADSEVNIAGVNMYSTASKGKVTFPGAPYTGAYRSASFAVVPSSNSDSVLVSCGSSWNSEFSLDYNPFTIIPASASDARLLLVYGIVDADGKGTVGGYIVNGIFKKGVLLYLNTLAGLEVKCAWSDNPIMSRSELIDISFPKLAFSNNGLTAHV